MQAKCSHVNPLRLVTQTLNKPWPKKKNNIKKNGKKA